MFYYIKFTEHPYESLRPGDRRHVGVGVVGDRLCADRIVSDAAVGAVGPDGLGHIAVCAAQCPPGQGAAYPLCALAVDDLRALMGTAAAGAVVPARHGARDYRIAQRHQIMADVVDHRQTVVCGDRLGVLKSRVGHRGLLAAIRCVRVVVGFVDLFPVLLTVIGARLKSILVNA